MVDSDSPHRKPANQLSKRWTCNTCAPPSFFLPHVQLNNEHDMPTLAKRNSRPSRQVAFKEDTMKSSSEYANGNTDQSIPYNTVQYNEDLVLAIHTDPSIVSITLRSPFDPIDADPQSARAHGVWRMGWHMAPRLAPLDSARSRQRSQRSHSVA